MSLHTFHHQTLKIRAGVVLFDAERILLMQQNGKPFWVLPGGTLEEGESTVDCAVRELQEEVGLDIEVLSLLALSEFSDATRHVLDVTFLGRWRAGSKTWVPPYPENIDHIAWLDAETFQRETLQPQALQRFITTHWQDLARGNAPPLKTHYLGMTSL
jgi:ADP-ribose pyrophosphatase YjhB (NUDIX family)